MFIKTPVTPKTPDTYHHSIFFDKEWTHIEPLICANRRLDNWQQYFRLPIDVRLKRFLRCILISVVHRQDIAAIKPTIFNVLVHNSDSNTNWIFLPISEFEERQQSRSIFIAPIYWQYNTQGRTNFTQIPELFFQV